MTSSTREKIISLIGAGVSQTIAAEVAGVTDGYVSQLLQEPGVLEEIAGKKSEKLESYLDTDDKIERGEKLALGTIVKKLESPFLKLEEALKAFTILNGARKKSEEGKGVNAGQAAMNVTLILPKASRVMLTVNSENQVIDVEGKSIAPLPSKVLPVIARELESARAVPLLGNSGTTRQVAAMVPVIPPHVTELKEKVAGRDEQRALSIMQDIEMTINGVTLVI